MEDKLQKLKSLLEFVDRDFVTPEQIAEVVGVIGEAIGRLEDKVDRNLESCEVKSEKEIEKLDVRLGKTEKEVERVEKEVTTKLESVKKQKGEKGDKGDSIVGPPGPPGKDGNIKELAPQEVRDLLELLQGDERLDKSAIKGLDEWMKKVGGNTVYVGGASGTGGKVVRYHDLSASLDGSTKTFALPAFTRVISVHVSSTPFILRPTVDYTLDGGAMSITFTSEINEAQTLATGQTLIVVYAEA